MTAATTRPVLHGTRKGYRQGCREECCSSVESAYQAAYYTEHKAVIGRPGLVPADRVVRRLRELLADGWILHRLADVLGVHRETLKAILARAEQGPTRCRYDTARRVLTARIPSRRTTVGTTRRVRALTCLGWTATAIARQAGVDVETVKALLRGETTNAKRVVRDAIAEVYDALSMRHPHTTGRRASATAARNRAARAGWAPPLAWDDETIDDPSATPTPAYQPSHRVDLEEAERLLQWGVTPDAVAARLGTERRTLARAAYRHDRPDLGRVLDQKPARANAA